MHVVRPKVEVKGLFLTLGLFNKGDRFFHKAFRDLRALHPTHPFAQTHGIRPDSSRFVGILPRFECKGKKLGPHSFEIGQRLIETVFGNRGRVGYVALTAHVPFAEVSGQVSRLLQGTG